MTAGRRYIKNEIITGEIAKMYSEGCTKHFIAKEKNMSYKTVSKILRHLNIID